MNHNPTPTPTTRSTESSPKVGDYAAAFDVASMHGTITGFHNGGYVIHIDIPPYPAWNWYAERSEFRVVDPADLIGGVE